MTFSVCANWNDRTRKLVPEELTKLVAHLYHGARSLRTKNESAADEALQVFLKSLD